MDAEIIHFGLDFVYIIDADGHFHELPGIVRRQSIKIILRENALIDLLDTFRSLGITRHVLFGAPFGQ